MMLVVSSRTSISRSLRAILLTAYAVAMYSSSALAQTTLSPVVPAGASGTTPSAALLTRSSTVAIKVQHFETAMNQIRSIAADNDAQLMDSKTYVDEKGRRHGWLRMRSSTTSFDRLRGSVQEIGVLYSDSVSTEDRTSDFESLGRRAQQLDIHQQRLLKVLNGPRHLRGSDILFVQDKLFRAGSDQQDLLQSRDDIAHDAQTATILVEVFEPNTSPIGPQYKLSTPRKRFVSSIARAHQSLGNIIDRVATASAYAVVYSPLWGSALALAIAMIALIWRNKTRLLRFANSLNVFIVRSIESLVIIVERARSRANQGSNPTTE